MGIVQIQLVDLFTTSVIKMMTLRSKPKRPYNPRGRHEGHNDQIQNSESKAVLRCGGHQCLLCGQTGLVQTRLLLTQHSFANSAQEIQ
jgi:hypothetical protein